MTTNVHVALPKPNHKRVRVSVVEINADGSEGNVLQSHDLDHGQFSESLCVHDSAMIRITEID